MLPVPAKCENSTIQCLSRVASDRRKIRFYAQMKENKYKFLFHMNFLNLKETVLQRRIRGSEFGT